MQYSPPIPVNPVKNADVTVMVFSEKMCAPISVPTSSLQESVIMKMRKALLMQDVL